MIEFLTSHWHFLIFGLCFSLFRELSEHGKEGAFEGLSDWWNTPKAHRNKHEWGDKYLPSWMPSKLRWWIFYSPLVFLTDAEHLFQLLSSVAVMLALWASQGGLESVLAFVMGANILNAIKPLVGLK